MRRTIAALLACVISSAATAASPPNVQVLVLGTYHMDNPGQDLVNVQAADVLTPKRQAGLAAVAAALGTLMEGAGRMVAQFGEQQAQSSIARLWWQSNDPGSLADASMYYDLLDLDSGEDQPGAELLGYWYMRNAKIFAKLRDVTRPGDHVVVLFGAGHKHWLEQIAGNSRGFEVVDAAQYLPAN